MSVIQQAKDLAAGLEDSKGKVSISPAIAEACGDRLKGSDLPGGGKSVDAVAFYKVAEALEEPKKKKPAKKDDKKE